MSDVAAQQAGRRRRPVGHAAQGERDEGDDDQGVEDDRREDRRVGRVQIEDVERVELRVGGHEDRGDDREVLREVVRDRERRQRAARDQQLLADLDDVEQLRRVRVEVDHVAGLLGGGGAGVHRDADIGLRERGRVVGAVAGHRDQLPALLLLADERELGLGRRLGEVVVDARLGRDRGGGQRVVARDHHGADAGLAHLLEARADAVLDDVLELDDAQHARVRRRPRAAWSRRARRRRRSRASSAGIAAAALLDEASARRRRRPCATRGRRGRRRSCASRPRTR